MSWEAILPTVERSVYRCAPHIVWIRDADRVILVDPDNERSWLLHGIEAAIWDWLTVGYEYERIVGLLSLILQSSEDEAGATLTDALRRWCHAGLVQLGRDA